MRQDEPERHHSSSNGSGTLTRFKPKLGVKEKTGAERRRHPRYSCFLRARILHHGGEDGLACNAYDISAKGMLLRDAYFATVPNRFLLSVPRRHMEEWVEVVRRSSTELGVRFVS
jgi:hypothetical protein